MYMPTTTSQNYTDANQGQNGSGLGDKLERSAREGMDILKENPVLTRVAVGVVGFAIGTLAGRSSVKNRSLLDANMDSLHRAVDAARAGTADTVGHWRKVLRDEGLSADQLPSRVKQQIRRLIASVS
jgi:hypothetical protein